MSEILSFKEDVIIQKLNEDTILLDLQTEEYFSLDKVGSEIIELFQKGLNQEEVIQELLMVYDTSEKRLDEDINNLINRLNDKNLLLKKDIK
ncbi:MAG: PqqD family protein [Halarcobacter sp.]